MKQPRLLIKSGIPETDIPAPAKTRIFRRYLFFFKFDISLNCWLFIKNGFSVNFAKADCASIDLKISPLHGDFNVLMDECRLACAA